MLHHFNRAANALISPSFRSQATTTFTTVSTVSPSAPSGLFEGDLMFATLSTSAATVTITEPSGWTLLYESPTQTYGIWYKFATATDVSSFSYTWTLSATATGKIVISAWANTSGIECASIATARARNLTLSRCMAVGRIGRNRNVARFNIGPSGTITYPTSTEVYDTGTNVNAAAQLTTVAQGLSALEAGTTSLANASFLTASVALKPKLAIVDGNTNPYLVATSMLSNDSAYSSLVVPMPIGVQDGDFLVMVVASFNSLTGGATCTGWTQEDVFNASTRVTTVLRRVAGSPLLVNTTSAGQTTSSTTITVNVPSGTANGDLMILVVCSGAGTTTWTTPSGWTLWSPTLDANGRAVFYRTASSEPASYTITQSISTTSNANILTYRNASIDVIGAFSTSAASPSVAPSITTTANNANVFYYVASPAVASCTYTTPTNFTPLVSDSDATAPSSAIFTRVQATAGSTGTASSTPSTGLPRSIQFAIKPTASEPSTYTVTTNGRTTVHILAFRGATTSFAQKSNATPASGTTSWTATGVTTTANNALILDINVSINNSATTFTTPTGYDPITYGEADQSSTAIFMKQQAVAGATGNVTSTSSQASAGAPSLALLYTINPA
jgi:hypothetical protein